MSMDELRRCREICGRAVSAPWNLPPQGTSLSAKSSRVQQAGLPLPSLRPPTARRRRWRGEQRRPWSTPLQREVTFPPCGRLCTGATATRAPCIGPAATLHRPRSPPRGRPPGRAGQRQAAVAPGALRGRDRTAQQQLHWSLAITQPTRPTSPSEWHSTWTQDGREYFYNSFTGVVQWQRPLERTSAGRDAPWGFLVIVSCPLDEPVQGWQRSCTTFSCQRAMAVPHQHTAARDPEP